MTMKTVDSRAKLAKAIRSGGSLVAKCRRFVLVRDEPLQVECDGNAKQIVVVDRGLRPSFQGAFCFITTTIFAVVLFLVWQTMLSLPKRGMFEIAAGLIPIGFTVAAVYSLGSALSGLITIRVCIQGGRVSWARLLFGRHLCDTRMPSSDVIVVIVCLSSYQTNSTGTSRLGMLACSADDVVVVGINESGDKDASALESMASRFAEAGCCVQDKMILVEWPELPLAKPFAP